MTTVPSYVDYPEPGSGATIRVSFWCDPANPHVPRTAHFARLQNGLPKEELKSVTKDWASYAHAEKECLEIAASLAKLAKVVDGFEVWASASQLGDDHARAEITTKAVDGSVGAKAYTVITDRTFSRLEDAKAAANDAVQAVQSVNEKGVPHPLTI